MSLETSLAIFIIGFEIIVLLMIVAIFFVTFCFLFSREEIVEPLENNLSDYYNSKNKDKSL